MTEPAEPPRQVLQRAIPFFLVLLVLAGFYFFLRPSQVQEGTVSAERLLPNYAAPGSVIPVRVRLEASGEMKGFILREHFPKGWKLIEANPPASSLDNEEGTARWIVKPGEDRRMISYLLRADRRADLGTDGVFSGEVVANPNGRNEPSPVAGASQIRIALFQWADLDGDGVIDDSEMLQASDTVDQMKGVHLDWNQLEEIWDAGGYRWDEKRGEFVPEKPSHSPPSP